MLKELTNSKLWGEVFLGNSLKSVAFAVGSLILSLLILRLFQSIALKVLKKKADKTETPVDDVFLDVFKSVKPPFYYFLAFYIAIQFLNLAPIVQKVIYIFLIIWVIYQVIVLFQILIDYYVKRRLGTEKEKEAKGIVNLLNIFLKIILWSLGVLFIMSNLGINITSLVAGLGIGGIALALALQNILKDLFSSFAIYFDRPFVIGDHIAIGSDEGVVKQIGIKTTRLQALDGEEIIVSNQELTSARVQNFSRIEKRRGKLTLNLPQETNSRKLEKILNSVKKVIIGFDNATLDHANIIKIDGKNFILEIAFYISTHDQNNFLSAQEGILLEIKRLLEKEKVNLA